MNYYDLSESDYESGVLSSCLKDLSWPTAYGRASEIINPSHFADTNKGKVFEEMGKLTEPPDEVVLADKSGVDMMDIFSWCERTETSTYVTTFAEGVLKCWTNRQANYIALELLDKLREKENPNDILANASKRITDTLSDQNNEVTDVGDGLEQVLQECFDLDEGKIEPGVMTGFTDLDNVLGGFKKGEMSCISARPSHGKTALSLSMAAKIAAKGSKVMFCSLEMSLDQLRKRLLHSEASVPIINTSNHYRGDDKHKLTEAMHRISGWQLKIDQSPGMTIPYLTAKAMSEKTRNGLDILFVDYIGIMNGPGKDIYERVTNLSRGMQGLAKKLDIPVVVLSQQNRESEKDTTAKMSHLRDSGSLEQEADQLIMLRRTKDMTDKPFQPVETMEVTVIKNRNGKTGTLPLTFSRSYARYDSTAKEPQPARLN